MISVTDEILLETNLAGKKEAASAGQIKALKLYFKTVLEIKVIS